MPDLDGISTLQEFQKLNSKVCAIAMSGFVQDADELHAIPFLAKPFTPERLLSAVDQGLQKCAESG